MNPISPLGHSVLWRKYGSNHQPSSVPIVKAETPHSSPIQAIDKHQAPCSSSPPCTNKPEWLMNTAHEDTPKSIKIEPLEEEHKSSTLMTLEECLEEKANIDRVLAERAKLGSFLLESTERPVIDDLNVFKESAEAIRAKFPGRSKSHLYDNIEAIKRDYRCYGLNHIDVIAIRLYTTPMSFVINEALRNYSSYGMPIPTIFVPYIHALLNSFAKLDSDRQMNEACGIESESWKVARYIPVLDLSEMMAIQPIFDTHQPEAYVMYPAFTSSSINDLAKRLWSDGYQYRFEIKARTAISVQDFSTCPDQFEAVFLPGTIFHILERDGPDIIMQEIVPQKLNARRTALPC